jgi:hypothetical protein
VKWWLLAILALLARHLSGQVTPGSIRVEDSTTPEAVAVGDAANKAVRVNVVAGGAGGGVSQLQVRNSADSAWINVGVGAESGTVLKVPVRVHDASGNIAVVTNAAPAGGDYGLGIRCISGCGAGTSYTDKAAFAEGTATGIIPAGAVFNDTITGDPTEDQITALRITARKGLHVNLRDVAGVEFGTAANPVRADPTGTTTQPVSGIGNFSVVGTKSNNGGAPGSTNLGTLPAVATAAAPTYTDGNQVGLSLDLTGALRVASGAGGTSSSFGAAFPATGTAAGFSDGTNMRGGLAIDLDTGGGAQYGQGVNLRKMASGGSVEAGTSADPLRIDPTGTTTQPVVGASADNSANTTTKLPVIPCRANAADPAWTEGNQVPCSVDLLGRQRVTLETALPAGGATIGSIASIATSVTPGTAAANLGKAEDAVHTSGDVGLLALAVENSANTALAGAGDYIPVGTDTEGSPRVIGNRAHDAVDAGNPLKVGYRAVAFGANPTAVAVADRSDWLGNRAGVPFVLGGHPNIVSRLFVWTTAKTDTAIVTVAAGLKVVVTGAAVTCDNADTVDTEFRIGFGTATLPGLPADGATADGFFLTHPGTSAGSGVVDGGGAGMLAVGADDQDVRITAEAPTTGSCRAIVRFFTVES